MDKFSLDCSPRFNCLFVNHGFGINVSFIAGGADSFSEDMGGEMETGGLILDFTQNMLSTV